VIFESGLQNLAGTPESYDARPEAVRFLEQVPTVWDETRLLSGRPADHAVFARGSGSRWFIGAGVSGPARTLDVPLDLPDDRWLVDLVRDGDGGLIREQRIMDAGDTLSVDLVAEGGFAAIACRWRAGLEACDRPVDESAP
jgi:alpha-glucosidase